MKDVALTRQSRSQLVGAARRLDHSHLQACSLASCVLFRSGNFALFGVFGCVENANAVGWGGYEITGISIGGE